MTHPRKKLIEIALPLEAINKESAREKSIRHGHPSTLHLWWARRPLAACRAVLFASLVDDPSSCPEEFPTEAEQEAERLRLFDIIEDLVKWENSNNEAVLQLARTEIARSTARTHGVSLPQSLPPNEVTEVLKKYAPPVLDPFAGGGSIPLEAQRLGLEAHASDLNPVAVLINKALIEIPPKFANRPPVHPEENKTLLRHEWLGAQGLAEDVRYYGKWMRDEAWKRIGHLYPKLTLSKEQGGGEATVIAWLWARTVTCPNPACAAQMPLVRSFTLSTKKGREVFAHPIIDDLTKAVRFEVRKGKDALEGTVNRAVARCLVCGHNAPAAYVRAEADARHMGAILMAVVLDGSRSQGRIYRAPTDEDISIATSAIPLLKQMEASHNGPFSLVPDEPCRGTFASNAQGGRYGFYTFSDYFTPRQLVTLITFVHLVRETRELVVSDVLKSGLSTTGTSLNLDSEAREYADAVATYLALSLDRSADRGSTICSWDSSPKMEALRNTFARQAISMTWDFAEGNPFSESSGNWMNNIEWITLVLENTPGVRYGFAKLNDATAEITIPRSPLISTDPPYYDNIDYSDLSDFFYVWLRRSLDGLYPDLFGTLLVPKAQELVAMPHRFEGDKKKAQEFFERGLGTAFTSMHAASNPGYPLSVYYAFKQAESEENSDQNGNSSQVSASTGWETMLEGLIHAEFVITGTWPMRSELSNRMIASGANALASSIVLVCRPRPLDAPLTSRGEFLRALKRELPAALKDLQRGNIAPVDLAQAAIGPGMAVFSRYGKVLESDGSAMRVRTALQLINQALDEVLAEQEGEYDSDTRWAVAWFEQYGMEDGPYGVAETLSKAKNTAVERLVEAGILTAKGGKVRLLRREELSDHWNHARQARLTVWEVTQRLIRALDKEGEKGAAAALDDVGGLGEIARDLAYRLYTTCERKGWTQDARDYNTLVVEWRDIAGKAERLPKVVQARFGQDF